jgi:hypothetical protein
MREFTHAVICNPILRLRLEYAAIGTGRVFGQEREIEQLSRKDQRLPTPKGHLEFETRAPIDTQADLVIDDDGGRMEA